MTRIELIYSLMFSLSLQKLRVTSKLSQRERLLHNCQKRNEAAQANKMSSFLLKVLNLTFLSALRRLAQSIPCVNCDNHQRVFGVFSYKMKRCIHYQARAHGSAVPRYVSTVCQLSDMKPGRLQGGRARAQGGKRIPSFVC